MSHFAGTVTGRPLSSIAWPLQLGSSSEISVSSEKFVAHLYVNSLKSFRMLHYYLGAWPMKSVHTWTVIIYSDKHNACRGWNEWSLSLLGIALTMLSISRSVQQQNLNTAFSNKSNPSNSHYTQHGKLNSLQLQAARFPFYLHNENFMAHL